MSHQLYGIPNSHGIIRISGGELLRAKLKDLLKVILNTCGYNISKYIMSLGTWADSISIQAVADVFNLKILIIESHPDQW